MSYAITNATQFGVLGALPGFFRAHEALKVHMSFAALHLLLCCSVAVLFELSDNRLHVQHL